MNFNAKFDSGVLSSKFGLFFDAKEVGLNSFDILDFLKKLF